MVSESMETETDVWNSLIVKVMDNVKKYESKTAIRTFKGTIFIVNTFDS